MLIAIQDLARFAGVSTRTLRFYDQKDLMKPVMKGTGNVRFYGLEQCLTLQQIIILRGMGLTLEDIKLVLTKPGSLLDQLEIQKGVLQKKKDLLDQQLRTIQKTITSLKENKEMNPKDMFSGLNEKAWQEEARQRWGHTSQFKTSQKRWNAYSDSEKQQIKAEQSAIMQRMVGDGAQKPEDPAIQQALTDYIQHIDQYHYPCDVAMLKELAKMWRQDMRFAKPFEDARPGGLKFVCEAVQAMI